MEIKTTYQQKQFISDRITPVVLFLNSRNKSINNTITSDLIRENGEHKNFIGIDLSYKKGSKKQLIINLFWGVYEKLDTKDDYDDIICDCENEKVFRYEKNIILEDILKEINNNVDELIKNLSFKN